MHLAALGRKSSPDFRLIHLNPQVAIEWTMANCEVCKWSSRMNREEGQGEGNLETYDSNQETTEYTQIGTLEIETEHVLSRFSWGEPISAHCTELFLNIP